MNRSRQASITKELIEIISGAEKPRSTTDPLPRIERKTERAHGLQQHRQDHPGHRAPSWTCSFERRAAGHLNALRRRTRTAARSCWKSPSISVNPTVRTIAMDTTDGSGPRPEAARTPARRSRCRSVRRTLGRILNVIGEPIDERGPVKATSGTLPIHRSAPEVRRAVDRSADPRSPASRSSTCSRRMRQAAARSACSAAPASARP